MYKRIILKAKRKDKNYRTNCPKMISANAMKKDQNKTIIKNKLKKVKSGGKMKLKKNQNEEI